MLEGDMQDTEHALGGGFSAGASAGVGAGGGQNGPASSGNMGGGGPAMGGQVASPAGDTGSAAPAASDPYGGDMGGPAPANPLTGGAPMGPAAYSSSYGSQQPMSQYGDSLGVGDIGSLAPTNAFGTPLGGVHPFNAALGDYAAQNPQIGMDMPIGQMSVGIGQYTGLGMPGGFHAPIGPMPSPQPGLSSPTVPAATMGVYSGPYQGYINTAAYHYNVDPNLLGAIVQQESHFKPGTLSPAGAMGLGQLMPGTAQDMGVTKPYDPQQSIMGTAQYTSALLDRYQNVPKAVAAYNWGMGNVPVQGDLNVAGLPPETQDYLEKVHGYYANNLRSSVPAASAARTATAPAPNPAALVNAAPPTAASPYMGFAMMSPGYTQAPVAEPGLGSYRPTALMGSGLNANAYGYAGTGPTAAGRLKDQSQVAQEENLGSLEENLGSFVSPQDYAGLPDTSLGTFATGYPSSPLALAEYPAPQPGLSSRTVPTSAQALVQKDQSRISPEEAAATPYEPAVAVGPIGGTPVAPVGPGASIAASSLKNAPPDSTTPSPSSLDETVATPYDTANRLLGTEPPVQGPPAPTTTTAQAIPEPTPTVPGWDIGGTAWNALPKSVQNKLTQIKAGVQTAMAHPQLTQALAGAVGTGRPFSSPGQTERQVQTKPWFKPVTVKGKSNKLSGNTNMASSNNVNGIDYVAVRGRNGKIIYVPRSMLA